MYVDEDYNLNQKEVDSWALHRLSGSVNKWEGITLGIEVNQQIKVYQGVS